MQISSPDFQNNQNIPSKYTCDGEDINPQLDISGAPSVAKSLVLIVDDPDAPLHFGGQAAGDWAHWLLWNIKPETAAIAKNSVPIGAVEGVTDFGRSGWGGPCPGSGKHRYQFKIYALDTELNIPSSYRKAGLEGAIKDHILDQAVLVGLYQRS